MYLFLIITFIVLGLLALVWASELQSTICFVLDRGGLWVSYSTGIGKLRVVGFQIRLMTGHSPRAWMLKPLTGRHVPVEFSKTVGSVFNKKWKPIHIPLRGAFDIGVTIIIRELNVQASLGIDGDAAATALLCGCITTVLQAVRAVSTRGEFIPKGVIYIKPVFNNARLSVHFKCILAIKTRHIIREIIESMTRRNKNGQPSNRKHYANDNGKYTKDG